jgi:putative membrane protein
MMMLKKVLPVALLLSLPAQAALAHPGDIRVRPQVEELTVNNLDAWFRWDFHPSIFLGTLALIALYTLAATVWRKKYDLSPSPPTRREVAMFATSMAVMYLSLDGVMHYVSDELSFAGHMAQHLLLQMIWAPLLVMSIPSWMLRPIVRHERIARFGRWISHPWRASLLFLLTMCAWHIPEAYELALRQHAWHIAEHLMFMVTAVIFWWPLLSKCPEVPRAGLMPRAAMIFLNMFPMKGLGLIIATHNSLLYSFYAEQPRLFALTPLGDQRVGGLMMWILAGLPLWIALGAIFVEWRRSGPANGLTGIAELDGINKDDSHEISLDGRAEQLSGAAGL